MMHFVRSKCVPFSVEDVKRLSAYCTVCAEGQLRFYQPDPKPLIKETTSFERVSTDFKGSQLSSFNRFLFTVIDKYSHFPFAFACLCCHKHLLNTSPNSLLSSVCLCTYIRIEVQASC